MTRPTAHHTAHADQFHAAAADARRRLDVIAASGRATVHQTIDPTGWLIDQAARFAAALTNTARVCPHLTPAPAVVHGAVWAPGVVVCPACTHLLTPTTTEDTTCDRCRATVTEIYPGTVAFGPILLAYGLCAPCQTAAGLAPRVEGAARARPHRPRPPAHRPESAPPVAAPLYLGSGPGRPL